jgi:hypothetical protein
MSFAMTSFNFKSVDRLVSQFSLNSFISQMSVDEQNRMPLGMIPNNGHHRLKLVDYSDSLDSELSEVIVSICTLLQ